MSYWDSGYWGPLGNQLQLVIQAVIGTIGAKSLSLTVRSCRLRLDSALTGGRVARTDSQLGCSKPFHDCLAAMSRYATRTACEMHGGMPFPRRRDPAEVLQTGDRAFDDPMAFGPPQSAAILQGWPLTARTVRTHQIGAARQQTQPRPIGVVRLVGNKLLRLVTRSTVPLTGGVG